MLNLSGGTLIVPPINCHLCGGTLFVPPLLNQLFVLPKRTDFIISDDCIGKISSRFIGNIPNFTRSL